MKRRPLQFRLTVWFALSVLIVGLLFAGITFLHLRHELRVEQWQRVHPEYPDYVLHGTYSKDEINDIAGHILHISVLVSIPFALVALLIGRSLSRRSFRPLASINSQLQQIEASSLDQRIQTPDADVELEAITRSINALLDRIEESYRDVAEFSARVAHELRTPLTLMRLQLEESSVSIDPALAETLQDGLHRLEGYVDQCLLIARAERGQLEINRESVHLATLISDSLEPYSLLAKDEGREMYWQCGSDRNIMVVPWMIRQILNNLLSNALRHGTGDVSVILEDSGTDILLTISNSFGEKGAPGTGIGLRIVDALVKAHGGIYHAASIEDGVYRAELRLVV